jgi:cell wall-associated NlpC family hydrolase
VLRKAVILAAASVVALFVSGCATGGNRAGAVPRPFPGAPMPPGAGEATAPPPDAARPTPDAAQQAPDAAQQAPDAARPFTGRDPIPLISTALSFRGIPYRNGGSDPSGFDCSGFVQWVFATHGIRLPREVRDQYRVGREVDDMKDVKAGDLVFFETVSRGASHVGLAIGGDQFVHAPSSRGVVRVEHLSAAYWARRFVGARRVDNQQVRATK